MAPNENTRIMALIEPNTFEHTKIRRDLMFDTYPIIALEIEQERKKNLIIFGIYRQWGNRQ